MTVKILIGYPKFYDWGEYIILLQKKFPQNIYLIDFEKDDILQTIELFNINYILSLTYDDMKKIMEINPKNCIIINNEDYNNIEIFDNKGKFCEFFINNDLEEFIPKTYKIKYNTTIFDRPIQYPAILKSTIGLGGQDVFIIKDLNDYLDKSIRLNKNYIVQEYLIDDVEYVGHFFFIKGKAIFSLFFKIFNDNFFHVRKGPSKKFILVDFNPKIFDKIFDKIKFTGPLNINFKYINGKILIFEVNPRFGGSIIKSIHLHDVFNSLINYLT